MKVNNRTLKESSLLRRAGKSMIKRSLQLAVATVSLVMASSALAYSKDANPHGKEIYPTYPTPNYSTGNKQQIERGEYLAKMGDCIACHTTTDGGKPFSGGLAFPTPFGTLYSPNITPDNETGIGKWTFDDFYKAMHDGVNPDGANYYPAFPYMNFSRLPKKDIEDIYAYIKSLPPVKKANKKDEMHFPFNIRLLQYGWKMLFFYFDNDELTNDPTKSAQWNRGRYIVDGLGHCGMCHTPMNSLGGWKNKYYLGGSQLGKWYAPNITSYAFKDTSIDDITYVFSKEKMVGGGQVAGPMEEVDKDSLEYMTPEDLQAVAVYLKSVPAVQPPKKKAPASGGPGGAVYESHCAACHATGAAGAPKVGNAADWAPRIKQGMPTLYKNAIHGINAMPAKGACMSCTDKQIDEAVDYMVSHSKGGSADGPKKGKKPRVYTLADGKAIYTANCAVCHASGKLGAPKVGDQQVWAPLIKQNMDVLFERTIKGYKRMPARGACTSCTDGELEAAVKYMVQESKTDGDYSLW